MTALRLAFWRAWYGLRPPLPPTGNARGWCGTKDNPLLFRDVEAVMKAIRRTSAPDPRAR